MSKNEFSFSRLNINKKISFLNLLSRILSEFRVPERNSKEHIDLLHLVSLLYLRNPEIINAKKVYILRNGQVVEEGSFEHLSKKQNGILSKMLKSQNSI